LTLFCPFYGAAKTCDSSRVSKICTSNERAATYRRICNSIALFWNLKKGLSDILAYEFLLDRRHSITDVFRKTYAVFPNAINFSWVQDPLPPIVVKISQLNWAAAGFSKVSQNIRCTSGQSALATIEKFGEDACFALTNSRRKGKIFNQRGEFAIFYFCRLHRNRRWRRRLAGSRVRSFRFLILFDANLQRHGQQEARRSDATY
jgi:hypothetical protein